MTTSNSHIHKGRRLFDIAGGKTTINEKPNHINDTSTTTHLANESKKTIAGNGADKVLESRADGRMEIHEIFFFTDLATFIETRSERRRVMEKARSFVLMKDGDEV